MSTKAINFYADAGCYNHSIRLTRAYNLDTELMRWATSIVIFSIPFPSILFYSAIITFIPFSILIPFIKFSWCFEFLFLIFDNRSSCNFSKYSPLFFWYFMTLTLFLSVFPFFSRILQCKFETIIQLKIS